MASIRLKTIRDTAAATIGVVLGLVPHVLHHIGLLVGVALISGAAGNVVLYAVGLVFSLPMLRRLHRHFRTLWAPAIAVVIFTALFSLSAFVVGPTISQGGEARVPAKPPTATPTTPDQHEQHHP